MNRNIPLSELITTLDQGFDKTLSLPISEAAMRLSCTRAALECLQEALFYVRRYKSLDTNGEGERRRQELIDDSESVISLICTGGLYP